MTPHARPTRPRPALSAPDRELRCAPLWCDQAFQELVPLWVRDTFRDVIGIRVVCAFAHDPLAPKPKWSTAGRIHSPEPAVPTMTLAPSRFGPLAVGVWLGSPCPEPRAESRALSAKVVRTGMPLLPERIVRADRVFRFHVTQVAYRAGSMGRSRRDRLGDRAWCQGAPAPALDGELFGRLGQMQAAAWNMDRLPPIWITTAVE